MKLIDPNIAKVFESYPEPARTGLLKLRELVLAEATKLPEIGGVEEVLRWGQPSYITPRKKAATTIRLGTHKQASFAIFAHCQSTVIANYAARFPGWDRIDGNRAVLFDDISQIEPFRLRTLVHDALTYHLP